MANRNTPSALKIQRKAFKEAARGVWKPKVQIELCETVLLGLLVNKPLHNQIKSQDGSKIAKTFSRLATYSGLVGGIATIAVGTMFLAGISSPILLYGIAAGLAGISITLISLGTAVVAQVIHNKKHPTDASEIDQLIAMRKSNKKGLAPTVGTPA